MQKEIIQIQLALFFKEIYKDDFEKISLNLKSKLGSSAKTLIPPIPEEAPDEIPRLSLFFEDFNINVGRNRLDIFTVDNDKLQEVLKKVHESNLGIEITRIGFVKTYFIDGNIETIKPLLNDRLKQLDINDLRLRINKQSTIQERMCNNIESLNIGSITTTENKEDVNKSGLIITKDINHIPQKEVTLSKENQVEIVKAFDLESNTLSLITE